MYPFYWTISKGGIFMRYSYEFKRKSIELFYQGKWPKTPDGVSTRTFHNQIKEWVKLEQFHDPDINKFRVANKSWSPEEKYKLVCQVLSGKALRAIAIVAGINSGQLYQWVHKYETLGYNGLINKPKGRPPKDSKMKVTKNISSRKLDESEYEELIRLRGEKAAIIKTLRKQGHQLKYLLKAMEMAKSTYYFELSKVDLVDEKNIQLKEEIQKIFTEHKGRYGVRRVYQELLNRGFVVNHKRVQRLMNVMGLAGKRPKEKYHSYKGQAGKIADNIINIDFSTTAPLQKWTTDVSQFNFPL